MNLAMHANVVRIVMATLPKNWECPCCLENKEDKKVLTCAHVVCMECHPKLKSCPMCREKLEEDKWKDERETMIGTGHEMFTALLRLKDYIKHNDEKYGCSHLDSPKFMDLDNAEVAWFDSDDDAESVADSTIEFIDYGTSRRCSRCGEQGHIASNRNCPNYNSGRAVRMLTFDED